MMYKIKVKKTGFGWKITLLKKFWFTWLEDTVCEVKQGQELRVDHQINKWIEHFNIPYNMVDIEDRESKEHLDKLSILHDFITWYNSIPKVKKHPNGIITTDVVSEFLNE